MKLTRRAGLCAASITTTAMLATTAALVTTAASAAPSGPPAPACNSASMRLWTGEPGDGSLGHVAFEVEISNIGHHACTLRGYPGVSELNGNGKQVGRPASHSGPKSLVTIPVGGTSHFVLIVANAGIVCPGHQQHGTELRVFPPNQFKPERTPFFIDVCPHAVTMQVDAVHARAGIPDYSIR